MSKTNACRGISANHITLSGISDTIAKSTYRIARCTFVDAHPVIITHGDSTIWAQTDVVTLNSNTSRFNTSDFHTY